MQTKSITVPGFFAANFVFPVPAYAAIILMTSLIVTPNNLPKGTTLSTSSILRPRRFRRIPLIRVVCFAILSCQADVVYILQSKRGTGFGLKRTRPPLGEKYVFNFLNFIELRGNFVK